MKRSRQALVILLSIALSTVTDAAKAGPFREFFRTLRSAIAHPQETPRPHRSTHKRKKAPQSEASNSPTSDKPTPGPGNQTDVRWAKQASTASDQKSDLPYGTTVPGKPGLVTSPFAPDAGFVQVLGFSAGNPGRRSLHRQSFPYAVNIGTILDGCWQRSASPANLQMRVVASGLKFLVIII